MASEVKMPQLSDTMSSGKIITWHKKEGDSVNRGDVLAEVETEKANLEIEAFQSGVLLKILVPGGTTSKVGDTIAIIGQAGESIAATSTSSAVAPSAQAPTAPPSKPPAPQPVAAPVGSTPSYQAAPNNSDRVKASPLARKIAADRNINLATVQGSGPSGRIIRKDVELVNAAPVAQQPQLSLVPSSTQAAHQVAAPVGTGRLTPFSKMRETIARRMQESVTQSPHFYVSTSIDMGESKRLHLALKERPDYKGISINHLVIKATAYGLAKEPRVNMAVKDGMIYEPAGINIGIITALEDGLLIPVIKDANTLPLKDIVFEARAAVERARAGRPNSSDLVGGTFSISNMGMHDVEEFTAIINPGQGGILAVSSIKEQPVVKYGTVVPGLVMKVTVSVDHRIIDGVMAATFLKAFKEALETPALLMV